jgi:hypothetical protein
MKIKTSLALVATAAVLAGCMDSGPRQTSVSMQSAPTTVEGSWTDPNGLVSTFSGGQFQTRTTDGTDTQMASGTYTTAAGGVIQISLYSNVKRTNSLVNCMLASSNQLNCTSDSGSQFSLTRRI